MKNTLLIVFAVLCLASTIHYISKYQKTPDTIDCGTLIAKDVAFRGRRSNTHSYNIFVVKFNNGEVEQIEPSLEDFYTTKTGDTLCYKNKFNYQARNYATFFTLSTIGLVFFFGSVFIKMKK